MTSRLRRFAGLLVAAGAASAMLVAPAAAADPLLPGCQSSGAGGGGMQGGENTECASPGNVQIDTRPPDYGYGGYPWDDEFWVL